MLQHIYSFISGFIFMLFAFNVSVNDNQYQKMKWIVKAMFVILSIVGFITAFDY